MLSSATITLLGVSALAAWLHIRGLALHSPIPVERAVGEGFALPLRVRNNGRLFAACAVTLRINRRTGRAGILPYLRALDLAVVEVPHRFSRRGFRSNITVQVASAFPFGLVRCEREFDLEGNFLALPRPAAIEDLRRIAAVTQSSARAVASRLQGEDELYGAREWRDGESLRRAHWGLTAKRRRLIVSEYRRETEGPLEVVLATRVAEMRAVPRNRSFDRAVSVAAAVCERATLAGREVTLRTIDSQQELGLPDTPVRGRSGQAQILRALAYVVCHHGDPLQTASKEARLAIANNNALACVLAGGRAKRPAEFHPRNGVYWIDVDEPRASRVEELA